MLFNTSIKKNILMGKPDASDDEIKEALQMSQAWSFVEEQPDKMDTYVGAGGNQLSGGQKQRLALARAFIKKPKLFIFDEATSALDKLNESEVQKAIENMKVELKGVTTIVIAHRLSTIKNADQILVLDHGKVVESGTHAELVQIESGVYSKLVADQERLDNEHNNNNHLDGEGEVVSAAEIDADAKQAQLDTQLKLAQDKMDEADATLAEEQRKLDEILEPIKNEKKAKKTFFKKLSAYNKPKINLVVGLIF